MLQFQSTEEALEYMESSGYVVEKVVKGQHFLKNPYNSLAKEVKGKVEFIQTTKEGSEDDN